MAFKVLQTNVTKYSKLTRLMDYIEKDAFGHPHTYVLSYSQLKEQYEANVRLTDEDFLKNIVQILHNVCIISHLKEIPAYQLVSDEGLIHQMVHFIQFDFWNVDSPQLASVREMYKNLMRLA